MTEPTNTRRFFTFAQVEDLVDRLVSRNDGVEFAAVWGVPRGGVIPALLVAQRLGVPVLWTRPEPGDVEGIVLVVDDLVDHGATAMRILEMGLTELAGVDLAFDALVRKSHSPAGIAGGAPVVDAWVIWPWELAEGGDAGPTDAVVRLLEHIGEDPTREGLVDTPKRVLKAYTEMTVGYHQDPADILGTTFDVGPTDELVIVRDIPFHSLCEHHMLGFSGTATVGYLPNERVVGLSKLARLVELYARRLQVQERMTTQISSAIVEHLGTDTAGVVVKGQHSCMACRGVGKPATMITSSLTGRLRVDGALRSEFMSLATG